MLPRWLPIRVSTRVQGQADPVKTYPATAYSGLPVRTLWRLIQTGQLRPSRPPGVRRLLLDRQDLDQLLESYKVPPSDAARSPA